MKISYGRSVIDISLIFVVFAVLVILVPIELGQNVFYGPPDPLITRENNQKLVGPFAFLITVLQYKNMSPFIRKLFWCTIAYLFLLSIESLFIYGTPFKYPHVVSKFFVVFSATSLYVSYRGRNNVFFAYTILFYTLLFFYNQFYIYRDVLNLSSFVNTERGLHAAMVHFLMACWLFSLAAYLPKQRVQWLVLFFIQTGLILFLNHRTVWLASITGMVFFMYVVQTRGKEHYPSAAFTPIIVVPVVAIILLFSYVFAEHPEILTTLSDRITDIQKVDKQGTGAWRLQQFESYLPFILEHPIIGMRWAGFELPVQFIAQQTGKEVFIANTGHHFHSFYVDCLFYHGLTGLALLSAIFVYIPYKVITLPVKLPFKVLALAAWSLSCLQYGLSYVIDDWHHGVAGMALAMLDTYLIKVDKENAALRAQYIETQNLESEQSMLASDEVEQ